mgnify:CR=1 FL=1
MSEDKFRETVISTLSEIQTNLRWIIKIGGIMIIAAAVSAGTLWMRTESNALAITGVETSIEAAIVKHYEEAPHGEIK